MRIPKSRRILGKVWHTKYKWNLRDDENTKLDGWMIPDERCIYIDRMLSAEEKYQTYLHELIHALMFELSLHTTSLSLDVEEIICEGLSKFLVENCNIRWKKNDRR